MKFAKRYEKNYIDEIFKITSDSQVAGPVYYL